MAHDNNDRYATICRFRHDAARAREKAIAAECSGLDAIASRFLSLADMIEDKANREQLTLAITR
jgi:hypothetical protein